MRCSEQCLEFQPKIAVLLDAAAAQDLQQRLRQANLDCEVRCGIEALEAVASLPDVDTVMAAIVGVAGLRPTLAAARAGKKMLLANKEALVTAGALLMDAVQRQRRDAAADRQRAQRDIPGAATRLRRPGRGPGCAAYC